MSSTAIEIRQALMKSPDPIVQEVANNPKLIDLITEQLNKGAELLKQGANEAKDFYHSKGGQAVVFGFNQIKTTVKMAGKVSSPSALTALIAQKFLFTGKLIAESDALKCGIAVGFLAGEGVVAVAAGVPTGGAATALMAAGIVSSAYGVYDSCSEVKFGK